MNLSFNARSEYGFANIVSSNNLQDIHLPGNLVHLYGNGLGAIGKKGSARCRMALNELPVEGWIGGGVGTGRNHGATFDESQ
jgi:hypothetical protein